MDQVLWIRPIAAGHAVHLANLTFCSVERLPGAIQHPLRRNLFSVGRQCATRDMYCPEAWLARWMWEQRDEERPVWCFRKSGVRPLVAAYQTLVDELGVDTVILVDGGVDALLRGDEVSLGTPAEDLVTLAAVEQLNVAEKYLVCTAMGAEMRDGISHAQVFERIAALTRSGAFLGSASLLGTADSGAQYLAAVDFTFENQSGQRRSHVHRVLCATMRVSRHARGMLRSSLSTRRVKSGAQHDLARGGAFEDHVRDLDRREYEEESSARRHPQHPGQR